MTGLIVPRDLHDVTPEWLTDALRAGGALGGGSVTAFTCEPINEGKGFMSQVARLNLAYDDDSIDSPRSVLLKLPSGPLLTCRCSRTGSVTDAARFSSTNEIAGSGLLSTPRSYHCDVDDSTGCTVLLLEWLTDARQGDSVAGCTTEEAYRSAWSGWHDSTPTGGRARAWTR